MSLCVEFLSALGSVPAWLQERTVNSLSACLSDRLSNPASEQYPCSVDTITACLDGFALGERVVPCIYSNFDPYRLTILRYPPLKSPPQISQILLSAVKMNNSLFQNLFSPGERCINKLLPEGSCPILLV